VVCVKVLFWGENVFFFVQRVVVLANLVVQKPVDRLGLFLAIFEDGVRFVHETANVLFDQVFVYHFKIHFYTHL